MSFGFGLGVSTKPPYVSTGIAPVTITGNPTSPAIGVAYSYQFTIAGGTGGPYNVSLSGWPAGLSVDATGLVTGTPTESGTFASAHLEADDGVNPIGEWDGSVTCTFSLTGLFVGRTGGWLDASLPSAYRNTLVNESPVAVSSGAACGLVFGGEGAMALGANITTDPTFDGGGWSGANWTIASGYAAHTAGASTALSHAETLTIPRIYKYEFTISNRTAGTATPRITGGTTLTGNTAASTNATHFWYMRTVTGNTAIGATPTSTFDGRLDDLTMKPYAGTNFAQATSARRPTWTDAAQDYFTFDGTDDRYQTTGGGGSTTAFVACFGIRPAGAGTARVIFDSKGTNTGLRISLDASDQLVFTAGNGSADTTLTSDVLTAGTDYVVTVYWDGSTLSAQVNNATADTTAFTGLSAGASEPEIGATVGGASFYNGRIYAGVWIKNSALNSNTRADLKTAIAALSGVTL